MDVSIIYVNYKTSELIINSINSVKVRTQGVSYEIIVVDNNSGDNSLEKINKAHQDVLCLASNENVGFGRANNIGIKQAKGRFILFLNPDTLLINNAIKHLKFFLENHPNYGACGGNLYNEERIPTFSFSRRFPSYFSELISIFYLRLPSFPFPKSYFYNYSQNILDVAFINGTDLMVRKSVIDKVGNFSNDFFMNFEDAEFCYRISKKGYKIGSLPNARITHLEGRSEYTKKLDYSSFTKDC